VGALCYYAKTYNFFFFIIHITIVLFILCKNAKPRNFSGFYLSKWQLYLLPLLRLHARI
jgi:hypothetical protein